MRHPVLFTFKKLVLLAGHEARYRAGLAGTTPARLELMLALAFGPVEQRHLARDLGVSPPVVSRMLKALEELGLVVRHVARDRRQRIVDLTDEGGKIVCYSFIELDAPERESLQSATESHFCERFDEDMRDYGVRAEVLSTKDQRFLLWGLWEYVRTKDYLRDVHVRMFHREPPPEGPERWRKIVPPAPPSPIVPHYLRVAGLPPGAGAAAGPTAGAASCSRITN